MRLARDFYERDTLTVARSLLGKSLVRRVDGVKLSGSIVEAEAYISQEDKACHASHGLTARTRVMFGPPGHAYVYFTYGAHWMFNVVVEPAGFPAAILIRALQPRQGIPVMQRYRARQEVTELCSGPGKLAQALHITGDLNGADLCARSTDVWIEDAPPVPGDRVATSPRIGLGNTPEPWLSRPWRFYIRANPFISHYKKQEETS